MNQKNVVILLVSMATALLAGCATNKETPNRQVAVYEVGNRVTYVSAQNYHCHNGEVRLAGNTSTTANTPAGQATATTQAGVSVVGRRCYYADRRGRRINGSLSAQTGLGGVNGRIGVGSSIGGTRIGVSGRSRLP